jgi:hypothetical protein
MTQIERSSRPLSGGSIAVRARRVQFTIRTLMIAVCVVGCALGLVKRWPEGLAVLVLLGLPLYGLSVLFGKIPRGRSAWRFGMSVVMLSVIMLGVGWFSARVLISAYRMHYVPNMNQGMWGESSYSLCLAIPAAVTAFGLLLNIVVLTELCVSRRRFGILLLVPALAVALALGWIGLFGWLAAERYH